MALCQGDGKQVFFEPQADGSFLGNYGQFLRFTLDKRFRNTGQSILGGKTEVFTSGGLLARIEYPQGQSVEIQRDSQGLMSPTRRARL